MMPPPEPAIMPLAARIAAATCAAGTPDPAFLAESLALAREAIAAGRAGLAVPLLAALNKARPTNSEIAALHGVALRFEQRLVEAAEVFAAARAAGSADPAIIQGLAQTRYELGQPAAVLFAEGLAADPGNEDLIRLRAAAMASEGEVGGAEAVLREALASRPGWLAGHRALATLRWTRGDAAGADASYAAAVKAEPRNAQLWLAWFQARAQQRDWADCRRILAEAGRVLGPAHAAALLTARIFLASESGDHALADRLLVEAEELSGDTITLCRIRHALRSGNFAAAEQAALAQLLGPAAALYWPYLSLAWRAQGDDRYLWIDRPDDFIRSVPVALDDAEYAELADVLRSLHDMERPYAEQSVRGGTQTDRSVMLRGEPIIARARAAWLDAIRGYVAALPAPEQGHPLLGTPRGELLIEGSWSVRLLRGGHNVPHNHPAGWISTAFYIALPDTAALGAAPAGHIAFGTPPEELGLNLPAYSTIAPQVGYTAIFPSTMWHRTMPFEDGERLALALDVRRPRW